jgi:hypothetical protein
MNLHRLHIAWLDTLDGLASLLSLAIATAYIMIMAFGALVAACCFIAWYATGNPVLIVFGIGYIVALFVAETFRHYMGWSFGV